MQSVRLSKSKILSGIQCGKRLWLEVNQPELIVWDASAQALFDIGHEVGEVAQRQFPGGVLVENQDNLGEAIKETARILNEKPDVPVFEGTFSHGGVLVRADVFLKGKRGYRLVEVKASTSVKDYHLNDTAIQSWVIEQAGYPLSRIELAHINNQFVYPGGQDYDGLLTYENVFDIVRGRMVDVPGWITTFQTMLKGDMPCIEVGAQCHDPYNCPLIDYCTGEQPEYPIGILPRIGTMFYALKHDGIADVRNIPEGYLTNQNHKRVRRVSVSGQAEVDPAIYKFVNELAYSKFYLDFETIQFAVPIWEGTRPYQQLPFQYSVHVETEPGEFVHKEFLDLRGDAPMRGLVESLIGDLGTEGPIIVYSNFEQTRLKELATMFPDLSKPIERILARLVDLLPLMRSWYYHPAQKGSWSIKAVLPTVAPELDYSNLTEVQDGTAAQQAYLEAINPETTEARKAELRERMLAYCAMDTMAMVRLVGFFQKTDK